MQALGHGRIDKAGFDRNDVHADFEQTCAQAFAEGGNRRFGGAVQIVGRTPTLAGHRGNDCQGAAALRLELVGQQGQQGDDGGAIVGKFLQGHGNIPLARFLIG